MLYNEHFASKSTCWDLTTAEITKKMGQGLFTLRNPQFPGLLVQNSVSAVEQENWISAHTDSP